MDRFAWLVYAVWMFGVVCGVFGMIAGLWAAGFIH